VTDTSPGPEVSALDAVAQAALVRAGEVSAVELTEWAIERIEAVNPVLNAVVIPTYDRARVAAGQVSTDAPLAGVPYLLKNLIVEMAGVPFTEGSQYLRGVVSHYDSELVRRLHRAGLVVLGRTNAPEFGMVPTCEPVLHGATRNPWDTERSTSGSSGGSAAAVASRMVPAAHGNDLGGSLRYPASACGLFGLKPTRARVPLGPEYGDAVSGWACEHALTVSVRDSAALLDVVSGPAVGDPYVAPARRRPFRDEVGADPGRLRVGYSSRRADGAPAHPDCVAALDDTLRLLADLGHEVVGAELPGLGAEVGSAIGTVFDAATAWIVGYWSRRLGRPPAEDELEPLTRAYLERGRRVTAADYLLAIESCQRFSRGVAAWLTDLDVWLTPTLSSPPAHLGEITSTDEEPFRALEAGGATVAYAGVVANITGHPAMSVPLWWNEEGLPIGVHFLGRFGDEATLFRLAAQLEAARPWRDRRPPVCA
jgi:amidase